MLPTNQVSWPFGSGEDAKNTFSRWQPWWASWISDRNGELKSDEDIVNAAIRPSVRHAISSYHSERNSTKLATSC